MEDLPYHVEVFMHYRGASLEAALASVVAVLQSAQAQGSLSSSEAAMLGEEMFQGLDDFTTGRASSHTVGAA